MNDMVLGNPGLYGSAWTRDTLLKLPFKDHKISQKFVEAVKGEEMDNIELGKWSHGEIAKFALPFLERNYVSQLV